MHISEVKKYSTRRGQYGEGYYCKKGKKGLFLLYDKLMVKRACRRYIKADTRKELER